MRECPLPDGIRAGAVRHTWMPWQHGIIMRKDAFAPGVALLPAAGCIDRTVDPAHSPCEPTRETPPVKDIDYYVEGIEYDS